MPAEIYARLEESIKSELNDRRLTEY